jgi:branched-chain amino acid transport system ATP-binding protein
MNALVLDKVSAFYGRVQALRNVSFQAPEGEITTVLGPNGAGKSSLLRAITGLLKIREGKVLFRDREIGRLDTHEIILEGIALVPENRQIFAPFTVRENLEMGSLPLVKQNRRDEIPSQLKLVLELFPVLRHRLQEPAWTLSGGMQQMLAIGRALMSNPSVLLLDEPSLGLAPIVIQEIYAVMKRLNNGGLTIVMVEQNVANVLNLATNAYLMETGEIVVHEIGKDLDLENILEVYLAKKDVNKTRAYRKEEDMLGN